MKNLIRIFPIAAFFLLVTSSGFAGFIDFENGTDGGDISADFTEIEFTDAAGTSGSAWVYGDWRTNEYNGPYPNEIVAYEYPLATQYYSNGNFFAWLGGGNGSGDIRFTQTHATYIQVGYSAYSDLLLVAYDDDGNILDRAEGTNNVGTGRMDILRVESEGIAIARFFGDNDLWLIDDLETDAMDNCTVDENCDDGLLCNGEETCVDKFCQAGTAVTCEDDGLFCNGEEVCSEAALGCTHSGSPCPLDLVCDENTGSCLDGGPENDDTAGDDTAGSQDDDFTAEENESEARCGC